MKALRGWATCPRPHSQSIRAEIFNSSVCSKPLHSLAFWGQAYGMHGHTPSRAHILNQGGAKLRVQGPSVLCREQKHNTPLTWPWHHPLWPCQEPLPCGEERRHPLGRPLLNAAISPGEPPTWSLPAAPQRHEVTPPVTAPLGHEGRISLAT